MKINIISLLILFISLHTSAQVTHQYHRILQSMPVDLFPGRLSDANAQHLMIQIGDGLVIYEGNTLKPSIADRWEISPDQKTYTFFLKPNLKFSDGSPINADAVIITFLELLSQDSEMWNDFSFIVGAKNYHLGKNLSISGINKISEYSVSFTIKKPYPPFIDILAAPSAAILPFETLKQLRINKNRLIKPLAWSGPYVLDQLDEKKGILLKKNTMYRAKDSVYYDEVIYDIIGDELSAGAGWVEGKYDDIWPYELKVVPLNFQDKITKIPSYTAFTYYLHFNLNKSSVKSPVLRQFIAENIDIDGFIKALGLPTFYKAFGLIPRGMLGYRSEPRKNTQSRVLETLLKKTGCSEKKPCRIELIYAYDVKSALTVLFKPLEKFSNIIQIIPKKLERHEWIKRFYDGNFELNYIANNSEYYDTYLMLRILADEKMFPGLERYEIVQLLEKALRTADRQERGNIYQLIDDKLIKQAAVVPLYHGEKPEKQIKKDIEGYDLSILGYPYLRIKNLHPKNK